MLQIFALNLRKDCNYTKEFSKFFNIFCDFVLLFSSNNQHRVLVITGWKCEMFSFECIIFAKIENDRVGLYILIFVVHEKSFVFKTIKTDKLLFLDPCGFIAA